MRRRPKHTGKKIFLILLVLATISAAAFWWLRKDSNSSSQAPASSSNNSQQQTEQKNLPIIDAQPTVDTWANQQSGTASVVVYDLANNKTVASLNPDKVYFSASIYKLFVAYYGYQKIADGTYTLNEQYLGSMTRGDCLDAMIRSSDIPCGEKMAVELGSSQIMKKLTDYGFENTDMSGAYATTSAADVAIILQRLWNQTDLSETPSGSLLDSMKDQPAKFRRGLPSGFTKSTVYDKVGWNENIEWHDTAIVTLPNNRSYVITVLTKNVGYNQIARLGKALEAKLSQ